MTGWYDNLLRSHFYYPDIDRFFIDIYQTPFDWDRGFQVYESKTPRVKMIILRLEDLDNLEQALGDFLQIDNFKMHKGNLSAEKWYQDIYKRFKKEYTPAPEELAAIYDSQFMRYFYSPAQIERFMAAHK